MKTIWILPLALLAAARAELLVYEPFDYATVNDESFGRLAGRNGGLGFAAPWRDSPGGDSFIYDPRGNPENLYGGGWGAGKPDWDGVVDNLPTMGGYVGISDWSSGGESFNAQRKLAASAGAMAAKNGGVLWLSAVWHFPENSFFAPVGIALTSGNGGFVERAIKISNNGNAIGVGNGEQFRNGMKRLNPMIWEKGRDTARTAGTDIGTKQDNIVILKFEFGATDTVRAWFFTEDQKMTEKEFDKHAVACTSSIDENTLDTLAFTTIRKSNAVDEFRIAASFQDVISGTIAPRQEVKITRRLHDNKSDRYFLSWTSNPGETYGIYESVDAAGYKPCVAAAVPADPMVKETTFGPFANPRPGNANVQFEIGLPDLAAPAITRVWGNHSTISIRYSESMLPKPATDPANYAVTRDEGTNVAVAAASFHPGNDTVVLTTATPLEPAAGYTVTTRNLTDRANLPLAEQTAKFRTFDDNPDGVKAFILAGQSNMVGRGWYDKGQDERIGGVGSLREQVEKDPTNFGHLVDGNKQWRTLTNMKFWWNRADLGGGPRVTKGDFTVGYGAGSDCIGPEFGFGWALHDLYKDQPVLLIKAAWGGKSLHTDYCSPTAAARRDGRIGPYYLQMMQQVHEVLDDLGKEFPEFAGKGYRITGFGWHQGYNDMLNPKTDAAYEENMADFIRDIRAEFGRPDLPFSIATTGHGGMSVTPEKRLTLAGQLAVADPRKHSGFAGNVFTVDSRPFQREVAVSPKADGSHWHNNGETLWLIGKGMGDGMVKMLAGK